MVSSNIHFSIQLALGKLTSLRILEFQLIGLLHPIIQQQTTTNARDENKGEKWPKKKEKKKKRRSHRLLNAPGNRLGKKTKTNKAAES